MTHVVSAASHKQATARSPGFLLSPFGWASEPLAAANVYDDGGSWKWTGVRTTNRSLSMKGELRSAAGEESSQYSEELTANGQLNWGWCLVLSREPSKQC
jgi:hypothetical protein